MYIWLCFTRTHKSINLLYMICCSQITICSFTECQDRAAEQHEQAHILGAGRAFRIFRRTVGLRLVEANRKKIEDMKSQTQDTGWCVTQSLPQITNFDHPVQIYISISTCRYESDESTVQICIQSLDNCHDLPIFQQFPVMTRSISSSR